MIMCSVEDCKKKTIYVMSKMSLFHAECEHDYMRLGICNDFNKKKNSYSEYKEK